ncbi:MAG: HD domain-containing protein [Clostridiales bacterium]|nr:HD domain-containing protein [Clostridiales bacterium]MBQ1570112.1 HD domain-containing protein [Clostridiales bacterium]
MEVKDTIVSLLKETKRDGIEDLIEKMEAKGFFTAPCSGAHHLSHEGGLAEHSLNVFELMLKLDAALRANTARDSIIICGILHDLGKVGDYGKPNYVENILKNGKQSESKPYVTNPDLAYIPHEIRSIAIAERCISLTEEEEFAILYHNGMYSDLKYAYSGKETPLSLVLHFADMWASRVTENEGKEEE